MIKFAGTLCRINLVSGFFWDIGLRFPDPYLIDPNERVTDSELSIGYPMPDLPDLSIAVTDIGVIPPPPMFR